MEEFYLRGELLRRCAHLRRDAFLERGPQIEETCDEISIDEAVLTGTASGMAVEFVRKVTYLIIERKNARKGQEKLDEKLHNAKQEKKTKNERQTNNYD